VHHEYGRLTLATAGLLLLLVIIALRNFTYNSHLSSIGAAHIVKLDLQHMSNGNEMFHFVLRQLVHTASGVGSRQTLASPAMGHWGTCPPPRLPASYFGGSLALQTLTSHAHGFLSSRSFSGHRFCRLSLDCTTYLC